MRNPYQKARADGFCDLHSIAMCGFATRLLVGSPPTIRKVQDRPIALDFSMAAWNRVRTNLGEVVSEMS